VARHLLDTNILSYLVDTASPFHDKVRDRLDGVADTDEVALSILSLYELHHWLAFGHAPRSTAEEVVRDFAILPLPQSGAALFGTAMRDLRGRLPRADARRHKVDCMIAATAHEHGAALVSNDGLFAHVAAVMPGLRIDNWTV
jgi:predicted nucleic acid-binding protein